MNVIILTNNNRLFQSINEFSIDKPFIIASESNENLFLMLKEQVKMHDKSFMVLIIVNNKKWPIKKDWFKVLSWLSELAIDVRWDVINDTLMQQFQLHGLDNK